MPHGESSNWVDRGEPLEPTVGRVLGHALGLEPTDPTLVEHVHTIRGLVEAGSTELHVARHLRTLYRQHGHPAPSDEVIRLWGIALWHIVKVGLLRDTTKRQLGELAAQLPPQEPLAQRLAAAILRATAEPGS